MNYASDPTAVQYRVPSSTSTALNDERTFSNYAKYIEKRIFFLISMCMYTTFIAGSRLYEPLKICLLFICKSCL